MWPERVIKGCIINPGIELEWPERRSGTLTPLYDHFRLLGFESCLDLIKIFGLRGIDKRFEIILSENTIFIHFGHLKDYCYKLINFILLLNTWVYTHSLIFGYSYKWRMRLVLRFTDIILSSFSICSKTLFFYKLDKARWFHSCWLLEWTCFKWVSHCCLASERTWMPQTTPRFWVLITLLYCEFWLKVVILDSTAVPT